MPNPQTTKIPESWSLFRCVSYGGTSLEGIIAKETIKGEGEIHVRWSSKGDVSEIAARLRELATALESRKEQYVTERI